MPLDELTFDEITHTYRLNGDIIPSVTTVMKPLSNTLYRGINDEVLNRAAQRGTIVHNAIENYIKYGVEDCPSEYSNYFEAYLKWRKDYNPAILSSEQQTYHKFMKYAGTIDCICEIDGIRILVDYKTSAAVNKMLTGVQTEAYAKAVESQGIRIDKKAILHIDKHGEYQFIEYRRNDVESWNTFNALMTIHNHIKKYQGGRN